jgi:hypothetical protein
MIVRRATPKTPAALSHNVTKKTSQTDFIAFFREV